MVESIRFRTKHGELSLEEVAGLLPGTGEVMASVSHCFAMCWHAALGGNRELATYYLNRTRNLLRGLAVTRPKYTLPSLSNVTPEASTPPEATSVAGQPLAMTRSKSAFPS